MAQRLFCLAPQVALTTLRAGFDIIPIARPFLAPCKRPSAGSADLFGQVGLGVALLGHDLACVAQLPGAVARCPQATGNRRTATAARTSPGGLILTFAPAHAGLGCKCQNPTASGASWSSSTNSWANAAHPASSPRWRNRFARPLFRRHDRPWRPPPGGSAHRFLLGGQRCQADMCQQCLCCRVGTHNDSCARD